MSVTDLSWLVIQHTSLRLLPLSQELHGGALKWRRHLVCVIEGVACPSPDFLHLLGNIVRDVGAILGDRCGHLRLGTEYTVSKWLKQEI